MHPNEPQHLLPVLRLLLVVLGLVLLTTKFSSYGTICAWAGGERRGGECFSTQVVMVRSLWTYTTTPRFLTCENREEALLTQHGVQHLVLYHLAPVREFHSSRKQGGFGVFGPPPLLWRRFSRKCVLFVSTCVCADGHVNSSLPLLALSMEGVTVNGRPRVNSSVHERRRNTTGKDGVASTPWRRSACSALTSYAYIHVGQRRVAVIDPCQLLLLASSFNTRRVQQSTPLSVVGAHSRLLLHVNCGFPRITTENNTPTTNTTLPLLTIFLRVRINTSRKTTQTW